MVVRIVGAVLFGVLAGMCPCATLSPQVIARLTTRRHWLICGTAWVINVDSCLAFSNALPEAIKYADRPKRRGPMPKDLGLKLRSDVSSNAPELKLCGGAPNCFSTTPDDVSPEHIIEPWTAPSAVSKMQAWDAVRAAISAYPPGQQGIDGGGFQVVTDDGGYLYAQFESL